MQIKNGQKVNCGKSLILKIKFKNPPQVLLWKSLIRYEIKFKKY